MLHLFAATTALLVGTPMRVAGPRVHQPPVMFGFLKELGLEKPDFLPDFGGSKTPPEPLEVKPVNSAVGAAAKGMPLLGPIFNVEADLQAALLNLGSYDEQEVQAEIEETIGEAPVVIYTYPLSPFSSEAVGILESSGCNFKNIELGAEWFALGPKASATRVELRKLYGQGSLPHIFIGKEWIGGLATGADGGLAGLVERGELEGKLRKAKAI